MKNKLLITPFAILICLLSACSKNEIVRQKLSGYATYPEPSASINRSVIYLPKLKDESRYKVELIAEVTKEVDCNNHFFSGNVEQKTLKGYGYSFYNISSVSQMASTRMACPDHLQKVTKQIKMNHNLGLIRYNSLLPIVVYSPKYLDIKYKIWQTDDHAKSAVIN